MSFVYQDHTVNDRETSQEAKRRKDENGTSKRLFFVFIFKENRKELSAKQGQHKIKINISQHFVLRCLQKQQEHKSFLWLPAVGREREEQKIQIIQ